MALNFVTVTGQFYAASPASSNPAAGSILFHASDILWSTAGVYVGTLNDVGCTFNSAGQLTNCMLLAMDNAGLSGNWCWQCTITIGALTFPTRKLAVNFANGATQDLSALLNASTLL